MLLTEEEPIKSSGDETRQRWLAKMITAVGSSPGGVCTVERWLKEKKNLKIEEIRLKKIVKEELVNYPEELQIPGIFRLFFCKFRQVFF